MRFHADALGTQWRRAAERFFPRLTDAMIVQECADALRSYRRSFDRLIAMAGGL